MYNKVKKAIKIMINDGYFLINRNTFVYSQLIYLIMNDDFQFNILESDSPYEYE